MPHRHPPTPPHPLSVSPPVPTLLTYESSPCVYFARVRVPSLCTYVVVLAPTAAPVVSVTPSFTSCRVAILAIIAGCLAFGLSLTILSFTPQSGAVARVVSYSDSARRARSPGEPSPSPS
ncbi:hypothetical protein C8Q78DRAFT_1022063 [Trametes maxima]|nr:hypothetical protein C8Q78DRAFT_1022063 [Trametes maxima]